MMSSRRSSISSRSIIWTMPASPSHPDSRSRALPNPQTMPMHQQMTRRVHQLPHLTAVPHRRAQGNRPRPAILFADRLQVGLRRLLLAALALFTVTMVFAVAGPADADPGGHADDAESQLRVREFTLILPNGDEADVYAPRVPPGTYPRYEDAFPILAVLQGALVDKAQYQALGQSLAKSGFVVVIPNHFRRFPGFDEPVLFTEVGVVTEVYEAMLFEDKDPESVLYAILDTDTMGLVGHSLGGAVGLYAIAGVCTPSICSEPGRTYEPPVALLASAAYGANLVAQDGSVTDLDTSAAAVALIQGSLDGVAAPEAAIDTYPTLELPRALIAIAGANHYGICDDNNPPGSAPDPLEPTLSQERSNRIIHRWIGRWLQAELQGAPAAQWWIYQIGSSLDGSVEITAER